MQLQKYSRRSQKRWTLNKCLNILGYKDAYAHNSKSKHHKFESIYERIGYLDLEYLYKKQIVKFHPDLHPYNERIYYNDKTKEITFAYRKAIEIIKFRHTDCIIKSQKGGIND